MVRLFKWVVVTVVHPPRGAMMEFCGRPQDWMSKVKRAIENKIVMKKQTGS
jgi:hypothetical protein